MPFFKNVWRSLAQAGRQSDLKRFIQCSWWSTSPWTQRCHSVKSFCKVLPCTRRSMSFWLSPAAFTATQVYFPESLTCALAKAKMRPPERTCEQKAEWPTSPRSIVCRQSPALTSWGWGVTQNPLLILSAEHERRDSNYPVGTHRWEHISRHGIKEMLIFTYTVHTECHWDKDETWGWEEAYCPHLCRGECAGS